MAEPVDDMSAQIPTSGPSDADLWRCVEQTVHRVLLPAISDEWARAAAVQLVGLARYAVRRPDDRTAERAAELASVLGSIAGNELVAAEWTAGSSDPSTVMGAAGRILASAITRDDAAGDEVRAVLRPVVLRQVDDELAFTAPLVDAFRGKLDA